MLYLTLTRYDRGEDYSVLNVSKDYDEALQQFKEDLIDWFGYGPDDVSQIYFIKCKFGSDKEEQEKFEYFNFINGSCDLGSENIDRLDEFFHDAINDGDNIMYRYNGTDVYLSLVWSSGMDSDDVNAISDEKWKEYIKEFVNKELGI